VNEPGPLIHSAYAVQTSAGYKVSACVSDYDGIAGVLYVDADGNRTPLAHDGRGPWFFSLDLDAATAGTITSAVVRAESVRAHEVPDPSGGTTLAPLYREVPLHVVYTPTPKPPVLKDAKYDPATRVVYLKVLPGGDLGQDVVDWVRVFYDSGTSTTQYAVLQPVTNQFEDPYGYTVTLPASPPLAQLRLVAYSKGFLYRAVPLTSLVGIYTSGTAVALNAQFDYTATDWWYHGMIDLERVPALALYYGIENTPYVGASGLLWNWKAQVAPGGDANNWIWSYGLGDVYLRDSQWECSRFYLGFFRAAVKVAPGDLSYQSYNRDAIALQAMSPGWLDDTAREAVFDFAQDDVFLFRTSDRRLGKLIVKYKSVGTDWWTDWCGVNITLDYVVYDSQYAAYP
jgi:hypothetical protein